MPNLVHSTACTGCTACYAACPKGAVTMSPDFEGFLVPKIDPALCIECGKCVSVCPVPQKQVEKRDVVCCLAARSRDPLIRSQSSSGGVFSEFASQILSEGGCVYGATFDTTQRRVRHVRIEDKDSIAKLRGSKYVQSDLGDVFCAVKNDLGMGRKVLFVGTPCQAAGLKACVKGVDANLLTVDLVCYGVPSPLAFEQYVNELDRISKKHVREVKFRDKKTNGSWRNYTVNIYFDDGDVWRLQDQDKRRAYDAIMMSGMAFRLSCYDCRFRCGASNSDITIGDCWGVSDLSKAMDDDTGASLVLVHTEKGLRAVNACNLESVTIPFDGVIKNNPYYLKSSKRPAGRSYFFRHVRGTNSLYKLIVRCLRGGSLFNMIRYYIHRIFGQS